MMDELIYTPELFTEKAKRYLQVLSGDFKFSYSEFMASIRNQYVRKGSLSVKQQDAFMKFVRNHEINNIFKDDAFLDMNFGINAKRGSKTYVGVITKQSIIQVQRYGGGYEFRNAIEMECMDSTFEFDTTNLRFLNDDDESLVDVGDTIVVKGIMKTVTKGGTILLKNVRKG